MKNYLSTDLYINNILQLMSHNKFIMFKFQVNAGRARALEIAEEREAGS